MNILSYPKSRRVDEVGIKTSAVRLVILGLQLTTLYVLLGIKSSPQTEIRAWFHTSILRYFYNLLPSQTAVEDLVKVDHDAADYTEQHFSTFLTKAQAAGWDVDRSQLYPNSVRVCWKPQHRKSKQL